RDQVINKMIDVAGELPGDSFEVQKRENGELVAYNVTAREKLQYILEYALVAYHSEKDGHLRPSSAQLLTKLRRIEDSAKRLLMVLESDSRGTSALSLYDFGLLHFAGAEARLLQAVDVSPLGHSNSAFTGSGRLRTAIEGVAAIHRWAKA